MKKGQKLFANDGTQIALFPMDQLNITQASSPSSFSHCCGHPIDIVGSSTNYPYYAPCDCHLTRTYPSGNTKIYTSDKEVYYASPKNGGWSKGFISFSFTHDNNPPSQSSFKQGELIGHTGTAGMVTGDHCHLDCSLVKNPRLVSYGVVCQFGNECYALENSIEPNLIFFINDTIIVNAFELIWNKWTDSTKPPEPEPPQYEFINKYIFMDGMGLDLYHYQIKKEITPQPKPPTQYEWFIPQKTRPLTNEESNKNAIMIWLFFKEKGWTLQSVCGMLGNMFFESTVNPNRWEGDVENAQPVSSRGFGLVQWTPWTKIVDFIKSKNQWGNVSEYGKIECEKIQMELERGEQWIPTSQYPMSFLEFTKSTQSPQILANVFLRNYERPYDPNQPQRGVKALEYFEILSKL